MKSYEFYVTFVFDYANIGTVVTIDENDPEKAERLGQAQIEFDGISFEPYSINEISANLTGVYGGEWGEDDAE